MADGGQDRGVFGYALMASRAPKAVIDSVIISSNHRGESPFTLPHEIGHILTDDDHFEGTMREVNLMRGGARFDRDVLEAVKRLNEFQDCQINTTRLPLLK